MVIILFLSWSACCFVDQHCWLFVDQQVDLSVNIVVQQLVNMLQCVTCCLTVDQPCVCSKVGKLIYSCVRCWNAAKAENSSQTHIDQQLINLLLSPIVNHHVDQLLITMLLLLLSPAGEFINYWSSDDKLADRLLVHGWSNSWSTCWSIVDQQCRSTVFVCWARTQGP